MKQAVPVTPMWFLPLLRVGDLWLSPSELRVGHVSSINCASWFHAFPLFLFLLRTPPVYLISGAQFEATVQLPCSRRELGGYSLIMLLYLGVGSSAFPTRM